MEMMNVDFYLINEILWSMKWRGKTPSSVGKHNKTE